MDQNIDQMTFEDRVTAIRTHSQVILMLLDIVDSETITQILLEMEQLHQYAESHLDFDAGIERISQRTAA